MTIDSTAELGQQKTELANALNKRELLAEALKNAGSILNDAKKGVNLAKNIELDANNVYQKIKQDMKLNEQFINGHKKLIDNERELGG